MAKINKHIEIVRTTRKPFSSMGSVSCGQIQTMLARHYTSVGVSIVNNLADLEALVRKQPDLVFLGMKRLPADENLTILGGNEIWLAEYLDARGISYTGSDKLAMEMEFNKALAKEVVTAAGLPTAGFFTAEPGQFERAESLPLEFPLFIKPLSAGGGQGIDDDSVVHTFAAFQQKVQAISAGFGCASLVEQYLDGREFSVAILENTHNDELVLMPIEIITQVNARGDRILSAQIKTEDNEVVATVDEPVLRAKILALATSVYELLGARDFGRIDIRLDTAANPHFLEANLMPGPITRYFAGACLINEDIHPEEMLLHMVELGLARNTPVSVAEMSPEPEIDSIIALLAPAVIPTAA